MTPPRSPWRVATRRSALATAQARLVADVLSAATGRAAALLPLSTTGDQHPDRAVQSFDAKGLFVDGVRQAVLDGRAHCAVHSHKDLPGQPAAGLVVAAVPPREDPRDLLVTRDGATLGGLRGGATVGTSSARRQAQLQHVRRDLTILPLRGNLDTRLRRVAGGELDAVVVACAGVARLGPLDLAVRAVPLEHGECLHAPAQGALAVECRADDVDTVAALRLIDDPTSRLLVSAERAVLIRLQGGCTAPVGAHAALVDHGQLEVLAMLADPSGTRLLRARHAGPAGQPELVGGAAADKLLGSGGEEILQRLRGRTYPVVMGGP